MLSWGAGAEVKAMFGTGQNPISESGFSFSVNISYF